MLFTNLIIFLIACIILVISNSFLVKSLSKISSYLKLNEFAIGFILVAVATSVPEIFIGIMSAFEGSPALSIGNVIGANILDLTLITGIVAILAHNIPIESKIIKKDLLYMLAIVLLPVFLLMDHNLWQKFGLFPNMVQGLSRFDGIILVLVFIYYIYNLIKQETKFSKKIDSTTKKEAFKSLLVFLACTFFLIGAAGFIVEYAEKLSLDLNLAPVFIGLFLISIGTTLPELLFSIKTVLSSHQSMAVGDLVGSVITNSTLVLGITAIIHPVTVSSLVYFTSTLFMLFAAFIFLTFAESESGLSWKEGVSLILLYVLFIIIETYLKTVKM